MDEEIKIEFGVVNYIVCGVCVVSSLLAGFYVIHKDKTKRSVQFYLMADGNMGIVPVAFSFSMTIVSGVTYVSDPVEAYKYGQAYLGKVYVTDFH